jgi:hypothetical protein
MAHKSLLTIDAASFIGDDNGIFHSQDLPVLLKSFETRWFMAFDDTDEMAGISREFVMPQGEGGYSGASGSTLKVDLHLSGNDISGGNGTKLEVYIEAKTPNTDTLDMESASSFASANAATFVQSGTAGDPEKLTVTLSNDDGVQAGDLVRIGIRRNAAHGDDDAAGDVHVTAVELWEDTGA